MAEATLRAESVRANHILEEQCLTILRARAILNASENLFEKINSGEVPNSEVLNDLDSLLIVLRETIDRALEQNQSAICSGGLSNAA